MQPDSSPSILLALPDITISLSWPREQFFWYMAAFPPQASAPKTESNQ